MIKEISIEEVIASEMRNKKCSDENYRKQLVSLSGRFTRNLDKRVRCLLYGDLILTRVDGSTINYGKADKVSFENNVFYSYWRVYLAKPLRYASMYIERRGIRTFCRPLKLEGEEAPSFLCLKASLGFDNHVRIGE